MGYTESPVCVMDLTDRAQKASAIMRTGEEKQYGNLLLVKGVVK